MMVNITKVGIGRFLAGSYLALEYQKEMEENYRKGDWLEAAKDTGFFAVKMLPVVAPAFVFGTLAPVWGGVALGVVATAVIVEATGIGEWEDVRDLLLDPDPFEYYEVVAPVVQSEIIQPIKEYVTEEIWQKQLVDPIHRFFRRQWWATPLPF